MKLTWFQHCLVQRFKCYSKEEVMIFRDTQTNTHSIIIYISSSLSYIVAEIDVDTLDLPHLLLHPLVRALHREKLRSEKNVYFDYFHIWIYLFLYCFIYLFHFSINPQVDFFTERSCNLGIFLIPSHAIQPGWAEIESISSGSRLSLWQHTTNTHRNTTTTQYINNTKHNKYLRVEVFDSRLSDHRWRADTRPRATPPSPELSSCLKIKIIQGSLQIFVQTFQSWQGHC